MKSWVTFLLPDDEYKEKMILYFLVEGIVVLLLSIVSMIFYSSYFPIKMTNALLIPILIFAIYMALRYAGSGIEYTEVIDRRTYRKELKVISYRAVGLFIGLSIGFFLLFGYRSLSEVFIYPLVTSFVLFLVSLLSLKLSFKKNKELL